MDLDYLANVVKNDDRGRYPAAERMLRHLMGNPSFSGGTKRKKVSMASFPKVNDPEGLIRSIRSKRAGGVPEHFVQHTRRLR